MHNLSKSSGRSFIAPLSIILLLGLAFVIFFVGKDDDNINRPDNTMGLKEKIEHNGTIRVGMSTIVPWAMRNQEGNWIGYEIDVAEKFALDNNLKIEWVPTQWDGIIAGLLASRFDIIIGGMTITDVRSRQVDFTIPYTQSSIQMVVNRELTKDFNSIDDYNKPGVRIALRRGANTVEVAREIFPNSQFLFFDDEPQSEQVVINGQAEAFVSTTPTPEFAVLKTGDKLIIPFPDEPLGFSEEGMAVRKNENDMLLWLNEWIAEQSASGWLQERHAYWFNSLDWEE